MDISCNRSKGQKALTYHSVRFFQRLGVREKRVIEFTVKNELKNSLKFLVLLMVGYSKLLNSLRLVFLVFIQSLIFLYDFFRTVVYC